MIINTYILNQLSSTELNILQSTLDNPVSENKVKATAVKLIFSFAIVVGILFSVLMSIFLFWNLPKITLIPPSLGIISAVLSLYLLRKRHFVVVKYILSIVPTYLVTMTSVYGKMYHFSANSLMFLVPNLLIVLLAISPIMFFGYFRKKELLISLGFLIPVWFLFRPVHRYFGIDFLQLPYNPDFYINVLVLFIGFVFLVFYSIVMLQKINYNAKRKLQENLLFIHSEKKVIENLNNKLTTQSNLYKILDLMSDTRDLNYILNEVLIQILKVEKLHLLDKGIIFLKNKKGTLNIAAQHNVEILLNSCKEIKPNECLCGKALVNKNSIFCNHVGHQHDIQPEGMQPHGHYVEPILGKNGSVIGIINVYISPEQEKDNFIAGYLTAVAKILSVKITNIRHNENLVIQKKQIETQKNIIDETYSSIIESLEYAQSLQKSLLPTKDELDDYFEEHFVIFLPKDTVSGDFYFANNSDNKICFGVGDCTGHGIPGAFLASNAIETLKKVSFYNQEAKPNVILEIVRTFNEQRFHKTRDLDHQDSMDAALCEYNIKEKKLYYSGGFVDLVIVRQGELIIRKANRNPVGVYPKKEIFELHTIDIEKNDVIYLFSDGVYDQFGPIGDKTKKLKRKEFHKWIVAIAHLPLLEQKQILYDKIVNWKQNLLQTDDITIFAVKVL